MKKMNVRHFPERISLTLYGCRGGDKSNEGWFFLSSDEWEKFKVRLASSTDPTRSTQPNAWHEINVFSPDDFSAAIRDLRSQRYVGGCMMEPL
jgi:hypothetical protein